MPRLADLDWINTTDQGWRVNVTEHGGFGRLYPLDGAWAVLVAEDARGERLGWMYVLDRGDHLTLQVLYVGPRHRRRGVARAIVEHLYAAYPGEIVVGAWDRDLFDVWIKLGFTYKPHTEDERPGFRLGDMVRPLDR